MKALLAFCIVMACTGCAPQLLKGGEIVTPPDAYSKLCKDRPELAVCPKENK